MSDVTINYLSKKAPAQWSKYRLSAIATIQNGYPFESTKFTNDTGHPVVRIRDIMTGVTNLRYNGDWVHSAVIDDNDTLVGMDGDFNVNQWRGGKALLNQRVCAIHTHKNFSNDFLRYYLPLPLKIMNDLTYSTTVKHLSSQDIAKIEFFAPNSLHEQQKIVTYLNNKTQTLDKILTAKNRTHTQLSELRQAIITDNVLGRGGTIMSLQDTNIPWVGKIPMHWKVEKIKGVADIVLGKMLQSTEKEGYLLKPYLRAQNIRWEKVDLASVNEMWFSPNEITQYRLKKDDILVSEGGEVGRTAMWHDELSECYIQNSINRLRANKKKILPKYLLYVLESYGQAKVFENTVNRVSIAHLTREKLKEYVIPLPPLDEQKEIIANIQRRLHKIDEADKMLQVSISQLEEYRSSLISNVVGGKVAV
jgi:type I restriction enzyme, S subunit